MQSSRHHDEAKALQSYTDRPHHTKMMHHPSHHTENNLPSHSHHTTNHIPSHQRDGKEKGKNTLPIKRDRTPTNFSACGELLAPMGWDVPLWVDRFPRPGGQIFRAFPPGDILPAFFSRHFLQLQRTAGMTSDKNIRTKRLVEDILCASNIGIGC